jgi:hypothetical protein
MIYKQTKENTNYKQNKFNKAINKVNMSERERDPLNINKYHN